MTPCSPVCGFKTSPCVRSKRPRVYRHHAHIFQHMYAWCRHTRGRFECTHGGVLEDQNMFFPRFSACRNSHTHQTITTTTNNTTTTTTHTTQHNTQHHTEKERDRERQRETERDRERQREERKIEKERQRKRDREGDTRQEDKRR